MQTKRSQLWEGLTVSEIRRKIAEATEYIVVKRKGSNKLNMLFKSCIEKGVSYTRYTLAPPIPNKLVLIPLILEKEGVNPEILWGCYWSLNHTYSKHPPSDESREIQDFYEVEVSKLMNEITEKLWTIQDDLEYTWFVFDHMHANLDTMEHVTNELIAKALEYIFHHAEAGPTDYLKIYKNAPKHSNIESLALEKCASKL